MNVPYRLATTASCATLAFAMSGLAQQVSPPDDLAVVRWASQVYAPVAESVFGPPIAESLEPEIAWVATARIHFAYESEPEIQFALRKTWGGGVTADVARLRKPLLRQIRTLYRDHRQLPPSELAKLGPATRGRSDRPATSLRPISTRVQRPATARVARHEDPRRGLYALSAALPDSDP